MILLMEEKRVAQCLEALSNETRLKIFRYLVRVGRQGAPVGDIQKQFNIPNSTLSHHLARMIRVNMVIQERHGRILTCTANYELMDNILAFLNENCCQEEVKIP